MTNSCCFHSCGHLPLSHIFMCSMCKTFTAVGPLALASSAGILSKPSALPECRSLIALSTSDSSGDGSLSTSLKSMVCISLSLSFFWKSSSPYSFHLPRISVGLVSVMQFYASCPSSSKVSQMHFLHILSPDQLYECLSIQTCTSLKTKIQLSQVLILAILWNSQQLS